MNDTKYWVGFSLIPGIGRVRFSLLEKHFGDMARAWESPAAELKAAGLDSHVAQAVTIRRPLISLDDEMAKLERLGVRALTWHDDAYPPRLKQIYDLPPVLYVKGAVLSEDEWAVSVVGTRHSTIYGRQVAEDIVSDLARHHITIVSGLARGIDTVAHRTALEAGGRTVAVLACGLDQVYPPENAQLAREIADHGAVVSEQPIGMPPRADYFPRRNRIMSGMSLGTLVVEAGETSGALITARLANEQDREVFAVPGSILSPNSRGTNYLIQQGAKLVRNYQDILEELNLSMAAQQLEMKELLPPTDTESKLLSHLTVEPVHIDEVCRASGLPVYLVSSTLTMMELKGMVRQVGGMNYVLARQAREEYRVKVE
ncbi:MAG: DNA-protecting protein DprA [Chloroflexi bacterium]|nr:DNA-protecting protein DprA [Chloroflexota bacterium]